MIKEFTLEELGDFAESLGDELIDVDDGST